MMDSGMVEKLLAKHELSSLSIDPKEMSIEYGRESPMTQGMRCPHEACWCKISLYRATTMIIGEGETRDVAESNAIKQLRLIAQIHPHKINVKYDDEPYNSK